MFNIYRKEIEWGGRPLIIETGKVARQADGAVMVTYGDTVVLCTATAAKKANPGQDFFPLSVHYQEKTFAAGKIPGGFFKREGKPSEKEVLTSRLIDRPIRPLFPSDFRNETQVICTVLSHDMENDPDIVAMIGTSAALTISGVPFMGPIGGARVGYIDGRFVLNPRLDEMESSTLDLIVAGTSDGVLMVESEAQELDEDTMLKAVMFGHKEFQPVIDAIIQLAEKAAKDPWDLPEKPANYDKVAKELAKIAEDDLRSAYAEQVKQARSEKIALAKEKALAHFAENEEDAALVPGLFKKLEQDIVRGDLLKTKKRIDGRTPTDIRDIRVETGILPRAHGSALFTRGETQALVVATLGTGQDEQIIDALEGEYKERFMLHYNFPPYSVGEASRFGPPGRREIGHGKLAWRAVRPLLPTAEEFPYTLRVVSEITESNGSSSMATVCGTSLALMDAAVPLGKPISGIAMGLVKEGKDFVVLSDIMGDEDHLGDMDFKVAGTAEGITSLQMDLKITSIDEKIMKTALGQAKDGRLHILGEMNKALNTARDQVSEHAPRIVTIQIHKDKIREVIGSGGKVIRDIVEKSGAKVDIADDGTISIAAVNGKAIDHALKMINDIVAEPEVGKIYEGKVVRVVDFGAFVNFLGPQDGLVHISELAPHRVNKVTDIVNEGDMVKVKCLHVDERGKIKLSMKVVDQETGEEISSDQPAA